jgi:hypothetical protein
MSITQNLAACVGGFLLIAIASGQATSPMLDDSVAPTVTQPVPEHMAYVADSATGPGAEITYSADGGTTFDRPEGLKALGPDGKMHVVKARDYTHIRWQFKIVLKSKSVAYARFRAVVK